MRDDDKSWLLDRAGEIGLNLEDEQIWEFCNRVEIAVQRDDEPRWVAREFEFKAMTNNDN